MNAAIKITIASLLCCTLFSSKAQTDLRTSVLVIGGGTSGTAAGIQSARLGVKTLLVEETPWLGGMISAAGVSAIDGNHRLPSGMWTEFRNRIYQVYGGPTKVETGWVSNTLFEPHVADSIFKSMAAAEKNLTVLFNSRFLGLQMAGNKIRAAQFYNTKTGKRFNVYADVFVEATELGDVLAVAKIPYSLGMEAGTKTGERVGVEQSNNIVQDLTYVATLKDYGPAADCTIVKPANYNPAEFDASNTNYYLNKKRKAPSVDAIKMLEYGKLPNGKYMINWPIYGNDTYLNVVEMTPVQREKELVKAKEMTKRFVYFIQKELGFKNLGLADDEFPTPDRLALIPYHREARRVAGLVRFTMRHIAEPFTYGDPLYRTGIAVGDYPIDHHHKKNLDAPQHLEFYPIPSYSVPLGALIPQKVNNLVVAEKSISVSNVANGTTRLQPVVLLIGQAAGVLAAMAAEKKQSLSSIEVRSVQQKLLEAGAYLMPYIDVPPTHPHFTSIQRIGATGILRGTGIPYKWANQTWFYPDSIINGYLLQASLNAFMPSNYGLQNSPVKISEAVKVALQLNDKWYRTVAKTEMPNPVKLVGERWENWGLNQFDPERPITRLELAVLLDQTSNPFATQMINHKGRTVHLSINPKSTKTVSITK
jgi:hypothetical protein